MTRSPDSRFLDENLPPRYLADDPEFQLEVDRALIANFSRQTPINAAVTLLAAAIAAFILLPEVSPYTVLAWFLAQSGLVGLLVVRWLRRRNRETRKIPTTRSPHERRVRARNALIRAIVFAAVSGGLWGSTALALPDLPQTDIMALVIGVGAMAAGAATTLGGIPRAALAFILSAILPYTAVFMFERSDPAYMLLGLLSLVLVMGMWLASRSVHGTFIDNVTSRIAARRSLEDLESSRQDWQEVSSTSEGFGLFDRDGKLRFWNMRFMAWFSIGGVESGVAFHRLIEYLRPTSRAGVPSLQKERMDRYLAQWRGEESSVTEHLIGDVWILSEMTRTPRGNIVWTIRDITKQREREAEERALRQRLLEARQLQTIGQFSAGIAHDFNNVLAAIGSFAEFIDMKAAGTDEKITYASQRIMSACGRGADMVRNVLQFATVTNVDRRTFAFSEAFEQAVAMVHKKADPHIHFVSEDTTGGLTVNANESQIVQLLLNLGVNACVAIGDAGGRVSIKASAPERVSNADTVNARIEAYRDKPMMIADGTAWFGFGSIEADRRCILIEVSDTGRGIDSMHLARVFEPYVSTKKSTMRTGFGLAIVKSVVLAMHGALEVRSKTGQGTTFWIWLPISDHSALPASTASTQHVQGSERVLIVDDDDDVADGLAASLQAYGYAVRAINAPSAALDQFKAAPAEWDIIIADYAMPQMNGGRFAQAIKAVRADIPILLYTGAGAEKIAARAAELGLHAVLSKPVDARQVAAEIRRASRAA